MFEVDDRVYHQRYKEGYINSLTDDLEWAYVEFDNYDDILDDNIVKVPVWTLIKIS